jgi:hypothetical protein
MHTNARKKKPNMSKYMYFVFQAILIYYYRTNLEILIPFQKNYLFYFLYKQNNNVMLLNHEFWQLI